jgi:hypothetical protein
MIVKKRNVSKLLFFFHFSCVVDETTKISFEPNKI